jgi:phosphate starvation-inducible PhoH-like protein
MSNKQPRKKKLSHEEELEAVAAMNQDSAESVLKKIKVDIKCKTQNQKILVNEIKGKEIVICSGLPGTGKTYLSCAVALELLKNEPKFRKIVIVKSVTTLKDEEIGFLKGTMKEKMEPFMYSFMHNFEKVIGKFHLEALRNAGMIEEMPIAYMRGINIDNSIVIIDESQNISIDNIRTIMTRLGENSKMIFLGDENQIDMKKKSESSLNFIISKFKDFDEVGTVVLGEDDVVRNPLIKKIEKIFNTK